MSAIALYARDSGGFPERIESALAVLREAANEYTGQVVQSTSLGAEDMVITDLIARFELPVRLATLNTGMLHAQTVELINRIKKHYRIEVEVFHPVTESVVQFVSKHGSKAMYESIELRKACCNIRKIEPLERMMADNKAWVTGLRREQSSNRSDVAFKEPDEQGRIKFNPLADWSWADVWHYIKLYSVPYNPLHDEFMPSIGCEPCTRAIAVGEDFRAGRWWWEDETAKECGLHASHFAPLTGDRS
jgi:phosphoadenosine phosphosulfate reductase